MITQHKNDYAYMFLISALFYKKRSEKLWKAIFIIILIVRIYAYKDIYSTLDFLISKILVRIKRIVMMIISDFCWCFLFQGYISEHNLPIASMSNLDR